MKRYRVTWDHGTTVEVMAWSAESAAEYAGRYRRPVGAPGRVSGWEPCVVADVVAVPR